VVHHGDTHRQRHVPTSRAAGVQGNSKLRYEIPARVWGLDGQVMTLRLSSIFEVLGRSSGSRTIPSAARKFQERALPLNLRDGAPKERQDTSFWQSQAPGGDVTLPLGGAVQSLEQIFNSFASTGGGTGGGHILINFVLSVVDMSRQWSVQAG
jgi:hypothetical protein